MDLISMEYKKEEVKDIILYLLQYVHPKRYRYGFTFLDIREFLKNNGIKGYYETGEEYWYKLFNLLLDMSLDGIILERHFEIYQGRVDYIITQEGLDRLNKHKEILQKRGISVEYLSKEPLKIKCNVEITYG